MKKILIACNGHASVSDEQGQIPEPPFKGWLEVYLEYLERCGINPEEYMAEAPGMHLFYAPFKTSNGWNFAIGKSSDEVVTQRNEIIERRNKQS